MHYTPFFILIAGAAAAFSSISSQQEPVRQQPPAAPAAAASATDTILATWLLVGNDNEIALAEVASQRAENPEVKQFAQKLVADHRQMGQKLETFAARTGTIGKSESGGSDKGGTGTDTTGQPQEASAPKKAVSGELDHLALLHELGEQCLTSATKELQQKQGAEFDLCFVGMAIGGHMQTNDAMTVFQRHASSELSGVIGEGQKAVQAHLTQAKELAKKLQAAAMSAPKK
jgi:predicted outer membrane protein